MDPRKDKAYLQHLIVSGTVYDFVKKEETFLAYDLDKNTEIRSYTDNRRIYYIAKYRIIILFSEFINYYEIYPVFLKIKDEKGYQKEIDVNSIALLKEGDTTCHLYNLNNDILAYIISMVIGRKQNGVCFPSYLRCRLVSKRFRDIIDSVKLETSHMALVRSLPVAYVEIGNIYGSFNQLLQYYYPTKNIIFPTVILRAFLYSNLSEFTIPVFKKRFSKCKKLLKEYLILLSKEKAYHKISTDIYNLIQSTIKVIDKKDIDIINLLFIKYEWLEDKIDIRFKGRVALKSILTKEARIFKLKSNN